MDPSEFEGTLKQESDVLNAGSLLEEFFAPQLNPYNLSDFEQDSKEFTAGIDRINDFIIKWNPISFQNDVVRSWDEQAIKIAENREEYIQRRKILAKVVKSFKETIDNATDINIETIQLEGNSLIDKFKAEFDHLANDSKFSEGCFLATYKAMRDLPDPYISGYDVSRIMVKAQDILKRMHHMLSTSTPGDGNNARSNNQEEELQNLRTEHEERVSALKNQHQLEIEQLESKHSLETKNLESYLKASHEQQSMDLQQQYEKILAMKESELGSLLNSLQQVKHQILEATEKEKMLEVEVNKRRELEEKIRLSFAELTELRDLLHKNDRRYEELKSSHQTLLEQMEKEKRTFEKAKEIYEDLLKQERDHVNQLQIEVASRIPVDIESLATKLGFYQSFDSTVDRGNKSMEWTKLEEILIEAMRKNNAITAEARSAEQEIQQKYFELSQTYDLLKQSNDEKNELIQKLEKDLLQAHESIKTNRSRGNNTINYRNPAVSLSKYTSSYSASGSNQAGSTISAEAIIAAVDESSTEMTKPMAQSKEDLLLDAVESQRDRYMKLAKDREASYLSMKACLERLQEDHQQLRNENVELYRRLRYLRALNRSAPNPSSEQIHTGFISNDTDLESQSSLLRRRDGGPSGATSYRADSEASDNLDNKYTRLYEEKIDPFKLEEFDRQAVISRLNFAEKALAYIVRIFMQDSFARKVFIVYIALMHLFAFGYVIQVLNPQLVEEVDSYAKAKYAEETFAMAMDREHPDN
jgi:hypothetical protein